MDERKDISRVSPAGERKLSERWRLVADTGIETCRDVSHKEDPAFAILGIIYSITRNVDLGVRQRITGTESKLTLSGAAAFTF
ncbi:MAG: hypothetical protein H6Q52_2044 [Deltaproteobacteria bacterium]|nr:hypothetical protein [Deltaproteobacteria bacterium]